ncbi:MAG: VanZ family protein, partial [Calditrichaeota bacterium]
MLGNIVLFIPLGFLLYGLLSQSTAHHKKRILKAGLFAFGFSFFIEIFQLLLDDRYTSINDLLMNTAGAVLGAYVASKTLRHVRSAMTSFSTLLRTQPLWLIWCYLFLIEAFFVLAPFNLSIKLYHIHHHWRTWLASWGSLPGISSHGLAKNDLETFLFAVLFAATFYLALKLQKPLSPGIRRFLYGALVSFYPVLTLLSLIKKRHSETATFLVMGLAGVAFGWICFHILPRFRLLRENQEWQIRWNRWGLWVIYAALFMVHFFYPFQLHTYKVWLNLLSSNQWFHLTPASGW